MFDLQRSTWNIEDALLLAQTVTEALHSGLDGWEPEEQRIIADFLEDIATVCADEKDRI